NTLFSLGGTVLEGNHGGTILVWQPDADKPIREVKGLPARGGFSPDGKLLVPVSTGETPSARWQIWETQTGTLRGTFAFSLGAPDQHLAISADGHFRIGGESGPQVVYVVQTP